MNLAAYLAANNLPALDDLVPCFPFHRPYGALVVRGLPPASVSASRRYKSIETRRRPWPFDRERWIVVYNAARMVKLQPEALDTIADGPRGEIDPGPAQMVLGIVRVTGCRGLTPDDLYDALFYEPQRWAWLCEHPIAFAEVVTLRALGIQHPPQSFVYVDGERLGAVTVEP